MNLMDGVLNSVFFLYIVALDLVFYLYLKVKNSTCKDNHTGKGIPYKFACTVKFYR